MGRVLLVCLSVCMACSSNDVPVDCSISDLTLNLVSIADASGCNFTDGTIRIAAQGGNSGYEYKLQNGTFQSSGEFTSLKPGIYSFVVRDKTKCEATLDNITLMASNISFLADIIDNTKCVGGNGSITINMSGGQPPYQYKIGDEDFDDENIFTDLESRGYLFTVKDNADCIVELNISVAQGITHTSWSTEILPIMQAKCAVSGCHNGIARTNDFRIYADAKENAALIKTYTQDGYMPFEGTTINQDEKDLIACWVDEGALEN